MNTIPSSQKAKPNMETSSSEGIQELMHLYQHELNITEGSEFLDDAIRTKDQPLEERSIARSYKA